MEGEFSLKGPAALGTIIVLAISLTVNVVLLLRPQQAIQVGGPAGATTPQGGTGGALLPNGQPNPLAHIPKNPQDAVGMPDATGGMGTR